ncbi:MAG: cupredoxin family copper-binding protein [Terriglobales bacterium]
MRRLTLKHAGGLLLLALFCVQTAAAADNPSLVAITIDNFSFTPQEIKVKAGTTITWTNRDDIPHTVVSTEGTFKSKALDTDDKFTTTLTKPGTYAYFCSIHPKMTGKIVVE